MKVFNVAIMGLGTVGGGAYRILTENHDEIMRNHGVDVRVKRVLDLRTERFAQFGVPEGVGTTLVDDVINDREIDAVIEVMGGIEPALTFILRALKSGKNVISANKELIAKKWPAIDAAARENGVGFYHEASCVGGVPVIRVLNESFQGDKLESVKGIINGTTNYILSKMSFDGTSYDEALRQAQKLGYAEADPTADVEGFDAAYKLSILSSLAFKTCIPYSCISREGITGVTQEEIGYAKQMGYSIKLLAIGSKEGDKVEARVHPTAVKNTHPLAVVNDEFNAVMLRGDNVGNVMLYGKGAGAQPTGSAIVSDVVYCAKRSTPLYPPFNNDGKIDENIEFVTDPYSNYFVVLSVKRGDADDILNVFAGDDRLLKEYKYDMKTETLLMVTKHMAQSAIEAVLRSVKDKAGVKMFRKAVC